MFSDDDIYKYLKIKKDLEYKLIEEQYHFDSIPFRRKLSGFRLISTTIIAIICSVFTFLCFKELYGTFEDGAFDLMESYTFIGLAMGCVFGLFISAAFWILTIKPAGELFGSLEKSSNYGSGNYAKERIVSMQKIRDYLDELADVEEKIKSMRKTDIEPVNLQVSVEEIMEAINSDNLDKDEIAKLSDDFFRYAYGTWGVDKDSILLKYSRSLYNKEKDDLQRSVNTCKEDIRQLAVKRRNIDSDYEKASNLVVVYMLFVLALVMATFFSYGSGDTFCYVVVFSAVFGIGFLIMLLKAIKMPMALYRLEHDPQKVKNFALMNGLEPTGETKKKILQKMERIEKKLEFTNNILLICELNNFPVESR